jgi:ABC-type Zn uptake system ZnuABC Zn-binding protein ZnuA
VLGAGATGLALAAAIGWLARREDARDRYDSITAIVLVGALAGGVILAADVFHSGAHVETLLFGSLLVIGSGDLVLAAIASGVVLGAGALLEQRWLVAGFDPAAARALGARSPVPDGVLLALVALVAVAALSAVGALLATALVVVPAATTRLLCRRLRSWQIGTVVLAAVEGVAGLWLSVRTDAPPGATIAVLSGAGFALAALWRWAGGRRRVRGLAAAATVLAALIAGGCGAQAGGGGDRLEVVATTTQVGDLARQVGGGAARVTQILRPNTDPHEYEPRPSDVVASSRAAVVLVSGDGLDAWMGDVVRQAGSDAAVVDLGARVPVRRAGEEAGRPDPHWWHEPRNAEAAVVAIRDALTRADPGARATYARNAAREVRRIRALDAGIRRCFAAVPPAQRKLVTDHDAFGFFAHRYGIRVIGAVIPSQTTAAQPSAGDLDRLIALIRREHVRAVFPESSVSPRLAQAVARATGASADATLYGDTLGPKGSPAATYVGMEAANADAMVRGLTGGRARCAAPRR